ncbi:MULTISPECIES: PLP-dependent aminotransferase family protein [unclassified Janthinobacterium]|uniref:MocR-like pyridoxine biosynthesis transcription factor PdxR n=1 Tax=unclassified Janthinobacterium TaxID=2610881 RepID=UPI001614933D|nr:MULTISPECIES: PLP-dependent aminotransferase family protein [unclassified Janthinobacterium]MBB5609648.1 GntR family transcriptional regulator/MocR family aminotransferase [Janthinobacterium sp. S3T4]MBB5614820.1 GntR family transcriptional regulator/MocR family aminotransferase [Janthinobacterium sp. S3M3]
MPRGKSPQALDLPRPANWLDQEGVSKQTGAYEALRSAILGKLLPAGSRLPSSRTLAERWQVSRGTIEAVFDRLHAEAYVTRIPGSGTRVCAVVPERFLMAGFEDATPAGPFSEPAPVSDTGVREGLPFVARRADASLFPMAAWSKCATRALAAATPEQLCSDDPAGDPGLRRHIADYLGKYRGVRCSPQDIVVTTGIRHGLDLLARSIVRAGDKVCLEDPGYPAARALFAMSGALPVDIPVDAEGIDCAALRQHADASLVYVTPAHHSPLGVTMSVTRRLELLEWARDSGAWVVEDDYDSEFNYHSAPLAALKALDQYQRVVYCGSFNKTLFTGLRVGFMVLPPGLLPLLLRTLQATGRSVGMTEQLALAAWMEDGAFVRHLRQARHAYKERRDLLLACLERDAPGRYTISGQQAGFHCMLWLPPGSDERVFCLQAAQAGLALQPLGDFCHGVQLAPAVLIGYTALSLAQVRHAAQKLALLLLID